MEPRSAGGAGGLSIEFLGRFAPGLCYLRCSILLDGLNLRLVILDQLFWKLKKELLSFRTVGRGLINIVELQWGEG